MTASVEFERPAWLFDDVFAIKEISKAVDVHPDTVRNWLKNSRMMGVPLSRKIKSKQLLNGHDAYVVGILGALHNNGIDCPPSLIRAAHGVTRRGGRPCLPQLFEAIALNECDGDGKPVAQIVVDLGQVWLQLQPKLEELAEREASR